MSPKDLAILHGEKAVVGIIGVICLWTMYGAINNPDIRASDATGMTAEQIKEEIAYIEEYRPKAQAPKLKDVPRYANRLASDLANAVTADTAMAWTTAHPDLGPTVGLSNFFYLYEAVPPQFKAEDQVGAVSLSLGLPPAIRTLDRIGDGDDIAWKRAVGATVENHATIIGARIQRQDGDTWVAVGDIIPFEKFGEPIHLADVKDFATYTFRSQFLIAASGYRFGQGEGGSVLVHAGRALPEDADEDDASAYIARLNKAVAGIDEPALVERLVRPEATVPAGVVLEANETLHVGPWSEPASVTVSSPIRFQLTRLSPDPDNVEATFLLTKLMRDGERSAWLEMQTFKVKPGEKLGAEVNAPNPLTPSTFSVPIDLRTPFELVRVERDVERTIYHQLRPVSRKDGKPGRELDLRTRTTRTDVAVLKNTRTGEEVEYVKLGRITVPLGDTILDPALESGDEAQWFRENPTTFKQQPLKIAPPIKHEPGTGPLEELHQAGDPLAITEVPYYELSTGELIYWETINATIMRKWKLGVTPPEPVIPRTPAPSPTAPNPGQPAIPPQDMPPEMMPPDMDPSMMPPDMDPGMMPPDMMPPEDGAPAPRRRRAR